MSKFIRTHADGYTLTREGDSLDHRGVKNRIAENSLVFIGQSKESKRRVFMDSVSLIDTISAALGSSSSEYAQMIGAALLNKHSVEYDFLMVYHALIATHAYFKSLGRQGLPERLASILGLDATSPLEGVCNIPLVSTAVLNSDLDCDNWLFSLMPHRMPANVSIYTYVCYALLYSSNPLATTALLLGATTDDSLSEDLLWSNGGRGTADDAEKVELKVGEAMARVFETNSDAFSLAVYGSEAQAVRAHFLAQELTSLERSMLDRLSPSALQDWLHEEELIRLVPVGGYYYQFDL